MKLTAKVIKDSASRMQDGSIRIPFGYEDLDAMTLGLWPEDLVIIAGRPSMGKAQDKMAKIMTPSGWKRMYQMEVGSLVATQDGSFTEVVGVYPQGERECYRVTMSDGAQTVCDGEHLWRVRDRYSKEYKTLTLNEIKKKFKIKSGDSQRNRYRIDRVKPLQFEKKKLNIDPWLMGFFLGDGCGRKSSCTLTITDKEHLVKIKSLLPDTVELVPSSKNKEGIDYRIRSKIRSKKPNDFTQKLIYWGLHGLYSYEKFIPWEYLMGSEKQRWKLWQGLVETDGHKINDKWYEYSTTSELLAEDVQFLVRSLGGKCTIKSRMGSYKKEGVKVETRINYRLYITFDMPYQYIDKIEPAGKSDCICIQVKHPSQLYVTDDFIVTHNTSLLVNLLLNISQTHPVMVESAEMSINAIIARMLPILTGIDTMKIRQNYLTDEEKQSLNAACTNLIKRNIHVYDDHCISYDSLMRHWEESRRPPVVFIDYLQLLRPTNKGCNRAEDISNMTLEINRFAKVSKTAVVLLSQLNRECEQRNDKSPKMSDLRDSGMIEQTADKVILIHRPDYYKTEDKSDGVAYLILDKNREGPTGKTAVRWIKEIGSFTDVPLEYREQAL